jgi:hypothetical protein
LTQRQLHLYSPAEMEGLLQSNAQALAKMDDYVFSPTVAFPSQLDNLSPEQYAQQIKSRPVFSDMNKLFWLKFLQAQRYRHAGNVLEASKAQRKTVEYIAQNLNDPNIITMALSIVQLKAVLGDLKHQLEENGQLSSEEKQLVGLLNQMQQSLKTAVVESFRRERLLSFWAGVQICTTFPRYLCQPNASANILLKEHDVLKSRLLQTQRKYPDWNQQEGLSFPTVLAPNIIGKVVYATPFKIDTIVNTLGALEQEINLLSKE